MADMIKFFKGLEASLPTSGVNGALYITTDEGGIYLGTGTGMKRLGDFVQVANVASLPAKAHENCLYYCVSENILAKWNGAEWKQINKQPTADEMKTLLGLGSMAYKSEIAEGDLNADLKAKVNAAAEGNHSHDNKALLDTYTQTEANLADAVAKKHAHTFVESELNKIADGDVAKWNAVVADHLDSEDLTTLENSIKDAKKAGTDANTNIEAYKVTNDAAIDAIEEDIAEITDGTNGILAQAKSYSDGKLATARTEISAEIDADVKVVADDLAAYVESNDEALAGVKATAEAARTEEEVDSQIDTKIAALNLGTTYEPIGAEDRAKSYVDGKFTDANLDQYTTEQEVKDIVDTVIAGAVDGDTITGLANLVEYLNTHGAEAKEMGSAIDVLEGKVETIEGKPAYGITPTQISNWDGEVGAKALAETKLDASTFTEYSNAHAGDYTNKQIDDAIDADVKAAIDAEVLRANGAYDASGAAATAQAAAIADAATKYETIGTAQGIVDGLKLSETYEPIGAETRAIAAAKSETETQVKALADGQVKTNTEAIATKANAADVYAKTETFTKDEVNAAIAAAVEAAHTWGEF